MKVRRCEGSEGYRSLELQRQGCVRLGTLPAAVCRLWLAQGRLVRIRAREQLRLVVASQRPAGDEAHRLVCGSHSRGKAKGARATAASAGRG